MANEKIQTLFSQLDKAIRFYPGPEENFLETDKDFLDKYQKNKHNILNTANNDNSNHVIEALELIIGMKQKFQGVEYMNQIEGVVKKIKPEEMKTYVMNIYNVKRNSL